jgi:hypothetical protein
MLKVSNESSNEFPSIFEGFVVVSLMLLFLGRGFTKFSRAEYMKYKSEGRIVPDGVNAKVYPLLLQFHVYILIVYHAILCKEMEKK